MQRELEDILRGAVIGLRDGSISSDGLDTFKLGYELVRDEIGMHRDHLERHAGRDDNANVVIVKTARWRVDLSCFSDLAPTSSPRHSGLA